MIIIGILAAIAIPVFLNQRKNAVDASYKSDLRTVANEMETYYTDNEVYPATAPANGRCRHRHGHRWRLRRAGLEEHHHHRDLQRRRADTAY